MKEYSPSWLSSARHSPSAVLLDESFEVWQFERGRVAHDVLMSGLLAVSLFDYAVLKSTAMLTPAMDVALAIGCIVSLVLRHMASLASDKQLAYRIAAPLVGLLGLAVNVMFALLDSAVVDPHAPFETQAALMDIGVNALILGCIASTFALPLWYGAVVVLLAVPADLYLIYCAAVASATDSAAEPGESPFGAFLVIFSAKAVVFKYFGASLLAYGVFAWLTISNRWLYNSLQQVALSNSKERYIAALSHDFGTPIAALDLALRSFDRKAEAAVGEEVLSGMHAAVRTLSIVKGKALNLSRMHAGERLIPNRRAMSVRAVFVELEDLARLMYKREGVSVSFWVESEVHVTTTSSTFPASPHFLQPSPPSPSSRSPSSYLATMIG